MVDRGQEVAGSGPLPEQYRSAHRKREMILRLLRRKDLGEVSHETQGLTHEVERWRGVFLEAGMSALTRRGRDPTERELVRTRPKIGER